MNRKLEDLLQNINIINQRRKDDIIISSVEYDSRNCKENSLFVAIKGTKVDGHNYISTAIKNGATAIVCQELPREFPNNVEFIQVSNSSVGLAIISHNYYYNPSNKMKVIGVTGTNGKTTVTFILRSIFELAGYKCGIIGTTGILIGDEELHATHTTPQSKEIAEIMQRMVKENVQVVIMEVSSHALHQNRAYGVDFDAAIFTNLSHEHLDYHITMENYANAKKILFDMLGEDSFAIINSDDKYAERMVIDTKAKIVKVGRKLNSDMRINNEELLLDKINFNLNEFKFTSRLFGRFNIENLSLAAVASIQFGINLEIIRNGIKSTNGALGRMQRILLSNQALGIVDYAHTPDALEKALLACKELIELNDSNAKLICVFGCGGDRDNKKRPIMGRIASEIADIIIITNDNPRTESPNKIIEEITIGIPESNLQKIYIEVDRALAIKKAYETSFKSDIILVAGKGHEKYQIIGNQRLFFDDVQQLEKYS